MQIMYVVAEPEFQDSASFIFSVRVFSVLQWCALSMVDLSFKMIVMHGWNRSQEKNFCYTQALCLYRGVPT